MTWKDTIKKESGLNEALGIVTRELQKSDIYKYLDNPKITKKELIDLLDEIQETLDNIAESDYEDRKVKEAYIDSMRARESL